MCEALYTQKGFGVATGKVKGRTRTEQQGPHLALVVGRGWGQ